MSTDHLPQPHGRGGLIFLALINLAAAFMIGAEISNISTWKTASSGGYTIAEAAYLGSLWTKVLVYAVLLLAFDVFCLGIGACVRISQLHRAVLSQSDFQPSAGTHPGAPPAGRLTHPGQV